MVWGKSNRLLYWWHNHKNEPTCSWLAFFSLLMDILPVKYSCTLTIIARVAPLVLLVVAGHFCCNQIFSIWDNMLLSHPFWKFICGLLGWVPTRSISLWHAVFLDMALFNTLVTSYIWPGNWTSSRAITISSRADPEINLLQSFVDRLFNDHSVWLRKWRLVLRLLFDASRFPLFRIQKIAVFMCSLLYKGIIGYDILLWDGIHVTHTKFLDKLRNLLVLMYIPQTESGVIIILKYASDVP